MQDQAVRRSFAKLVAMTALQLARDPEEAWETVTRSFEILGRMHAGGDPIPSRFPNKSLEFEKARLADDAAFLVFARRVVGELQGRLERLDFEDFKWDFSARELNTWHNIEESGRLIAGPAGAFMKIIGPTFQDCQERVRTDPKMREVWGLSDEFSPIVSRSFRDKIGWDTPRKPPEMGMAENLVDLVELLALERYAASLNGESKPVSRRKLEALASPIAHMSSDGIIALRGSFGVSMGSIGSNRQAMTWSFPTPVKHGPNGEKLPTKWRGDEFRDWILRGSARHLAGRRGQCPAVELPIPGASTDLVGLTCRLVIDLDAAATPARSRAAANDALCRGLVGPE